MTRKQLKQFAKKIADFEFTIQNSTDSEEVEKAKEKSMKLINSVEFDLDEMQIVDELTQKYLSEKNLTN